jgi:hypothetical protein
MRRPATGRAGGGDKRPGAGLDGGMIKRLLLANRGEIAVRIMSSGC